MGGTVKHREMVPRGIIVLSLLGLFAAGFVAPASSSVDDRPAANGLVLFEGWPNVAEFFADEESMGPKAPLYDIWTVDPVGGISVNLTNAPGVDMEGAWSPDGTHIAFASNRDGVDELDFEIYVMEADGTSVKKLTDRGWPYSGTPQWSPDGRRIAFARGPELWMMRADGSQEKAIFRDPSNRAILLSDWSLDGRSLLFEMDGADSEWDLWSIRPNGRNARRLVPGGGAWGASFSPDGKKIAFARTTLCEVWCFFDLYVANRDGSNETNITNTPHISEADPSWSPDGTLIAFTGDNGTGRTEMDVWMIGPEGGIRRPLTLQPRTWDRHPDWQPRVDT